jgi:hypothetical protein
MYIPENTNEPYWRDIKDCIPAMQQAVIDLDAKCVVEIGTRYGNSTLNFLEALEKTDGHLTSIDINDCQGVAKINPRWRFLRADSRVFNTEGLNPDINFIDGDHSYVICLSDLNKFCPITKLKVFVHDTRLSSVSNAIKKFLETNADWDYENLRLGSGLGVLTRKEKRDDSNATGNSTTAS